MHQRTRRFWTSSALFIAMFVSAAAVRPAAAQTADQLPATAAQQMRELLADKQQRTPAQRKISSHLLYASRMRKGEAVTASVKALLSPIAAREDGRVEVDITGDKTVALREMILNNGGEIPHPSTTGRMTRAIVPLDLLETIAGLGEVRSIHPAFLAKTNHIATPAPSVGRDVKSVIERLQRTAVAEHGTDPAANRAATNVITPGAGPGSVLSQGVGAMDVVRARKWFGVDGTGIKIGVLSDSDDFKEAAIATGDLPADTVTVPGQDGRPGAGEGTAMMQLIHDVAPGAQLFFASAFNSPESFADNIRTLRFTYGCDIIVDDVIYFFEAPYQDDVIAQAVIDVTNDGAQYFSSAGNQGNLNDGTSGTWEGDFKKARTALPTLPAGYEVHDFGSGVVANRITVGGGPVILHWSDAGSLSNPLSGNDYDVFVLTPDLRSVAVAATDIQDGNDQPFEFLGFNIPAGYQVVVARHVGAATRAVRLEIFGGTFALATDGALYGHAAVTAAFAVAAIDAALAGTGPFTGGVTTQVESFSADGPRMVFYDPNGVPLGSTVTFKGTGGVSRNKPDISAPDGVSTTLPAGSGLNPFFGTSAAAPHAAAVAALLKAAKPNATNTRLRNALTRSATDIEAAGRDRDSGFGAVNAFNALTNLNADPAVFLEVASKTVTPTTGDGDAYLEPGESANLSVTLANNGGRNATQLAGLITTTTPGVTITRAVSPYPAIVPGATGVNTTPFAFSLSPTAVCGNPVQLTLSTSYSGPLSPQTFTFQVPTGQPSTTPTAFSFTGPRAAIPDNNAAGVNIQLPVSGIGSVADVSFSIDGTTCSSAVGSTTVGLDHSWVGDLVMKLTSPQGTTVTLMNRPGGTGNSGNNFCQTVLSDTASTSIQNIAVAGAPWTGSFQPAEPLSAFAGQNGDGVWTLNVSDLVSIDTGGVRAVTLNLKGYSCN